MNKISVLNVKRCNINGKKIIAEEPNDKINNQDINALSNDKVDVEIELDVKSNNVNLQMSSCSIVFNCFSHNSPESK